MTLRVVLKMCSSNFLVTIIPMIAKTCRTHDPCNPFCETSLSKTLSRWMLHQFGYDFKADPMLYMFMLLEPIQRNWQIWCPGKSSKAGRSSYKIRVLQSAKYMEQVFYLRNKLNPICLVLFCFVPFWIVTVIVNKLVRYILIKLYFIP